MALNAPSRILESSGFTPAAWTSTSTSLSRSSRFGMSPNRSWRGFPYRSRMKAFTGSRPAGGNHFLRRLPQLTVDEARRQPAHERHLVGLSRPDFELARLQRGEAQPHQLFGADLVDF